MAATITRLRTRPEREQTTHAEEVRQFLLEFPGLPERELGAILVALQAPPQASEDWVFVMISPKQHDAVVSWLLDHSAAPLVAVRLWSKIFTALRWDTGEVVMTREELAEAVGTRPKTVSTIMGELEGIGAISKRRVKIPGMRGQGAVRYYLNPLVGTHLTGPSRTRAQASAPSLRVLTPAI